MDYDSYVASKIIEATPTGFDVDELNPALFAYQADIVRWAIRRGKAALFEAPGLGKSIQEWEFAKHTCNATDMPAIIFAPLSVAEQMHMEGPEFGYDINICRSRKDVRSGINVTNYEILHKFSPEDFGTLIADECFAKGTPVDVWRDDSVKQIPIECVKVGDSIVNASGRDIVSDVHRRKVDYAVKVFIGGQEIICSPNHPWFTQRGWRSAQDLTPQDQIATTAEAMRMVWRSFHSQGFIRCEEEKILQSILLSEMANEPTGTSGKGSYTGSEQEARAEKKRMAPIWEREGKCGNRENSQFKPYVEFGNSQESFIQVESHEPQTFRAWGQRAWVDSASADSQGCARRELDSGICFITGKKNSRLSIELQDRLSESRSKNCYRGGWKFSLQSQETRRQERCKAGFSWVDGIEVLEQGNPELEKFRSEDGNVYFYDLGGTWHPSFSVNGFLVHNSSILKAGSFGKTAKDLTDFASTIPYRLAGTATPAPNDHVEILYHAEFLGIMREQEAKALFFTQDGNSSNKLRLKHNAVEKYYKWLASWAVALRRPSDLGYSDEDFIRPPVNYHQITIDIESPLQTGMLVALEALGIQEQRQARNATMEERVQATADLVNNSTEQWLVWCDLNPEGEALAKAIPGAIEVAGRHSDAHKIDAMVGFKSGKYRVVISKPSMWGFGLNLQHSHNMIFCGLGNSFEQYFQAISRQDRFGQKNIVNVYVVVSSADGAVVENIKRKKVQHDEMYDELIKHMSVHTNLKAQRKAEAFLEADKVISVPSWIHPTTSEWYQPAPYIDPDSIPFIGLPEVTIGDAVGGNSLIKPEWIGSVI